MNLDKQADVIAGFTSSNILVIATGAAISFVLSFLIFTFSNNFFAAFVVFMFLLTTVIAAVKLMQNLPEGFFMNYFENRKLPKIYMPGENNEPD